MNIFSRVEKCDKTVSFNYWGLAGIYFFACNNSNDKKPSFRELCTVYVKENLFNAVKKQVKRNVLYKSNQFVLREKGKAVSSVLSM